jgi:GGDEF domain-containing protein
MGVSIGISVAPDDGSDGETLLNASDEAMYAAKKTGKNQFTFYS